MYEVSKIVKLRESDGGMNGGCQGPRAGEMKSYSSVSMKFELNKVTCSQ